MYLFRSDRAAVAAGYLLAVLPGFLLLAVAVVTA